MAKMKKFMVVHKNPGIDCATVQSNWRKMAQIESSRWLKTYINESEGIRFCLWLSENDGQLKDIFSKMDVNWETIIPVDETVPDMWGENWDKHIKAETTADTLGN